MGLFNKLFGKAKLDFSKLLDSSIERLRLGIFAQLYSKFTKEIGENEAKFLAAAVLNYVVTEEPNNNDAQRYFTEKESLITTEAKKLCEIKVLAEACSYLYAAQTIYLAILCHNPLSDRSVLLGNRATELSIHIPNTYDLCGSGDAKQCIIAIAEYATEFFNISGAALPKDLLGR